MYCSISIGDGCSRNRPECGVVREMLQKVVLASGCAFEQSRLKYCQISGTDRIIASLLSSIKEGKLPPLNSTEMLCDWWAGCLTVVGTSEICLYILDNCSSSVNYCILL